MMRRACLLLATACAAAVTTDKQAVLNVNAAVPALSNSSAARAEPHVAATLLRTAAKGAVGDPVPGHDDAQCDAFATACLDDAALKNKESEVTQKVQEWAAAAQNCRELFPIQNCDNIPAVGACAKLAYTVMDSVDIPSCKQWVECVRKLDTCSCASGEGLSCEATCNAYGGSTGQCSPAAPRSAATATALLVALACAMAVASGW